MKREKALRFLLSFVVVLTMAMLSASPLFSIQSFAKGLPGEPLLPEAAALTPVDGVYRIGTAAELNEFRDIVNGLNDKTQNTAVNAVLTADIVLEGSAENKWTPISIIGSKAYVGNFDGQGHSITGLYVDTDYYDGFSVYAGLFGIVGEGGVVQNLNVSGRITANGAAAGGFGCNAVVGGVVGETDNGTIRNCHNNCNVTVTNGANIHVGGIVGQGSESIIQYCSNTAAVTVTNGTNIWAGGVVGKSYKDSIQYCSNSGAVTVENGNVPDVGGVVGLSNEDSIQYCTNAGTVTISVSGNAAGITDYVDYSTVTGCYYLSGTAAVGTSSGNGATVLTAEEFKDPTKFDGWDFTNDWYMSTNGPMPRTQEIAPNALFVATGADSGELSNLTAGASYSISGAGLTTATVITADTSGGYAISPGMTSGTLSVVKKGGNTTRDSDAQEIVVWKADAPTTPGKTDCTTSAGDDGKLTGVTTYMEYKKSDASSWTTGTGSDITGLSPGTYYVRVKAADTTLASENQELTIAASYKTVTKVGKIGDGEVYMAIDLPPGVPQIEVSGITAEFAASLLKAEELAAVEGGAKLIVTLDMEKKDSTAVSGAEKASLENKAKAVGGNGAEIGLFLDIKLSYQLNDGTSTSVSDTHGNKVHMVLTVPDDLRNKDKKKTRTFFILRFHDNVAAMLANGTENEIPFDSDRFSTYALAYSDKQNSSGGGTTPTYYTVRFEMNEHGTAVASRKVTYGQKVPKPEDPEEEGYIFDGWYSDEELTTEYDFSKAVTKNLTLYAKWTRVCFNVDFDLNGQAGTAPETQSVAQGETAERPSAPAAEGFDFEGWYLDPDCTEIYDFTTPVTGNITLYAKWVKEALPDELVHRMYNPNSGEHFYTVSDEERDNLISVGWIYEPEDSFTAPGASADTLPVYRLYNPNGNSHHYTLDKEEAMSLVAAGWSDEGISFYAYKNDSKEGVPVYRAYNPNDGHHLFTTDKKELDFIVSLGWIAEGIAWNVVK